MNIINNSLSLPRLTSNIIDFKHVNVDESCGDMMVSFNLSVDDDIRFNDLFELLHDKIRESHYLLWDYEAESEFENSLNHSLRLVITMNDYGNYEFNLFNFAGEDYASVQIDLANDEIELFKAYMIKYFESDSQIEELRNDSVQTLNSVLPKNILNKMELVADNIIGNRYRSAWISYDDNQSIMCEIGDYTDKKCPVRIVKFGF